MIYSNRDMKLMALGEVGAFVLGITLGSLASYLFKDAFPPLRIAGTIACGYLATKYVLRFVHLGYKPNNRT